MNKKKLFMDGLREGKFKNISFLLGSCESDSNLNENAIGVSQHLLKEEKFLKFKEKYDNLKSLDKIQNIEITFLKRNPRILYNYMRENNILNLIENCKPSKIHFFIKLLEIKKILNLVYTFNLDGLEKKSGIDDRNILYAYGDVNGAICTNCRKQFPNELHFKHIRENKILFCNICSNACNYSTVYFDHLDAEDFHKKRLNIFNKTDLLFIIGVPLINSSHLFDYLNTFQKNITKIQIHNRHIPNNKEIDVNSNSKEFDYVFTSANQDEIIDKIVDEVGWKNELETLMNV